MGNAQGKARNRASNRVQVRGEMGFTGLFDPNSFIVKRNLTRMSYEGRSKYQIERNRRDENLYLSHKKKEED